MRKLLFHFMILSLILPTLLITGPKLCSAQSDMVMWINHLDFLPGDPSVITSFNAVTSGVGGGLSGLIIESTTVGEDAAGEGNKVVEKGLVVPPGYLITGVRVCYELSNPASYISQIRLAQLQDPPATASVLWDDGTDLTNPGPICVNSMIPIEDPDNPKDPVNPGAGAVRLSLRVNFGDPPESDRIVLRGVGLLLMPDSNSPIEELREKLENHSHSYLTGRGVGHNKVVATTGPASFADEPPKELEPITKGKKKNKNKNKNK